MRSRDKRPQKTTIVAPYQFEQALWCARLLKLNMYIFSFIFI